MNKMSKKRELWELLKDRKPLEEIKELLESSADINAQNKHGCSALMTASLYGHLGAVKLLLKLGANINLKDEYGYTALIIASDFEYEEIAELLKAKEEA